MRFIEYKLSGSDYTNKGFGSRKSRNTYFIEITFLKDSLMK